MDIYLDSLNKNIKKKKLILLILNKKKTINTIYIIIIILVNKEFFHRNIQLLNKLKMYLINKMKIKVILMKI